MIPEDFILEWRAFAPWESLAHVEQDLIISRALVDIYADGRLAAKLAFRGGTALHKVHLERPYRYSEDLDFLQISPEPIGPTLDMVRSALDPWLGLPQRELKEGLVKLVYRFDAHGGKKGRLKIEINSREHFAARETVSVPFSVNARWYSGNANIATISLPWLLGSKLRALYQRKKGRDLFDLVVSLKTGRVSSDEIVRSFHAHLDASEGVISRAEFEENLFYKISDPAFHADLAPLLSAEESSFDFGEGCILLGRELITKLRGEPWKGVAPKQQKRRGRRAV